MIANLPLFPEEASTIAGRVDALYLFLVALGGFFSVLIALLIIVFAVRYRRRAVREAIPGPPGLLPELTWTIAPFFVFLGIFVWGASIFITMRRPPDDAMRVFAVGKRWMWKIQHLEGRREINQLHVPLGQAVRVTLTSEDVIHSFFVPAFRVKQDAVPGRYTDLWFEAKRPGRYHLFCAEYCGSQHSRMIGEIVVLEPTDYQAWLAGESGGTVSMADAGRQVFEDLGCTTCHARPRDQRGPVLTNLYGSTVQLEGGRQVVADDAYLRESILNPAARVVAGFKPIMPTYRGLLTEEQLLQILAYLKSLTSAQPSAERAASAKREPGEWGPRLASPSGARGEIPSYKEGPG